MNRQLNEQHGEQQQAKNDKQAKEIMEKKGALTNKLTPGQRALSGLVWLLGYLNIRWSDLTDKIQSELDAAAGLLAALEGLLAVADSGVSVSCKCHPQLTGYTCYYCKAHAAIAKAKGNKSWPKDKSR